MKKIKKSTLHSYNVIFEPMKEQGYSVCFPDVPEICTFGATLKEAREMAKDALRCYLESVQKELKAVTSNKGSGAKVERITVTV